ncbi:MAG: diguanylate cyclase [Oscillospiraceae bacterium]|nr:diguanylate cyclase [Oscillospiraceae bacterium]
MRIKIKLAVIMLLILIIPITAVSVIASGRIKDYADYISKKNYGNVADAQSSCLGAYFENCISGIKSVSADESVRALLTGIGSSEDALDFIISFKNGELAIDTVLVCDLDGNIMATTDKSYDGKNASELNIEFIGSGAGVSDLCYFGAGINKRVVYVISRYVYSDDNEPIGTVDFIYNSGYFQKIISNFGKEDNTVCAIADHSGNIFRTSIAVMNHYSKMEVPENVEAQLSDIFSNGLKAPVTIEYKLGTKRNTIICAPISGSDWISICMIDTKDIISDASKYNSRMNAVVYISVIAAIAAIIVFIVRFTKPVDMMMNVVRQQRGGNSQVRFECEGNDEFTQITYELNKLLDKMVESEYRYKAIVEMTNNIIFEVNLIKDNVFVSSSFNKKFSFRPKSDKLEDSFLCKARVHKDDKDRFDADIEKLLSTDMNHLQGEYRIKDIYGDFSWTMIRAAKFYDRNQTPSKIIGVIVDIDRDKKSMINLEQRANYDALTHLYNRPHFIKTLDEEIKATPAEGSLGALMFVDLDNFKYFNDTFGHSCGDEVLKFVADTLKEVSYDKGFAGRLGGDEFVICIRNLKLYGDAGEYANEIISTLAKGYDSDVSGQLHQVHCSIGISFIHINGENAEDLINAADNAMYDVKKHGKGNFAYAKSE